MTHSNAWLVGLLLLAACSPSSPAPSQLAVWISADALVTKRLAAVNIQARREGQGEGDAPAGSHTFALADTEQSDQPLLFSFGITDLGPGTFTLAAYGCSDSSACERVFIEHKLRVRFEPQKTLQLHIHFDSVCARPNTDCSTPDQTCRRAPNGSVCVSVPFAETELISASELKVPTLPPAGGTAPSRRSGQTGELACPNETSCLEPYRCAPRAQDYTCLGRFAEWRMPDALPGAKTPPSYDTQSTPGVVRDLVTGLAWQQSLPGVYSGCTRGLNAPGDACTWDEARDYCENLELAGLDWRMPTFIELASLVDYRRDVLTLEIETFLLTTQLPHWTASPHNVVETPEPTNFLGWIFSTGEFASFERDAALPVRCVAEGAAAGADTSPHYIHQSGEQLILDNATKLVWYSVVVCRPDLTFADAEAYCSGISHRMRVPSIKELLTLVDPMVPRTEPDPRRPLVDAAFMAHATNGLFWSSTPSKQHDGKYVMWFGYPNAFDEPTLRSVRPVIDQTLLALAASDANDAGAEDAASTYCVRCVR